MARQNVGLNRVGDYLKTVPEKGPEVRESGSESHGDKSVPATGVNEPWRRISGLVGKDANATGSERRRKLGKLVHCIQGRVGADLLKREGRELRKENWKVLESWGRDLDEWRRVECSGRSVEDYCYQLGITRGRLTSLTKEYCGLSVGEIVDGVKVRELRKYLVAQLREAAQKIWGAPGELAGRLCLKQSGSLGVLESGSLKSGRFARGNTGGTPVRRSRYFRTRACEFFGLEPGEEERIRVEELLGALDALRAEKDWELESFAVRLGFESGARFKKACLTVMGRSMRQLERILGREIVDYYLAAEDRAIRELALGDGEIAFRAREVYWGSEEKPREPFLDRWSGMEFARAEWVRGMREEFG